MNACYVESSQKGRGVEGRLAKTLGSVAVALLLCLPDLAFAQLFGYFKAETESEIVAGLDQPTRDLITSLAPQARKEAIQFLTEALPLADKSVLLYLNRVDDILQARINQAVCAGQAIAGGSVDEVKAVITGTPPTPILDLVKQYESREADFESKPLTHIAISYEDFLGRAAITGCRINEPEARKRIDALRAQARARWKVWDKVAELCTKPEECLSTRYALVKELIDKSDRRDSEVSGAAKQLASVKVLPRPSPGILRTLFPSKSRVGPWVAFEEELLKIQRLEDSINTAKSLRLAFAAKALRDGIAEVIKGEAALSTAENSLSASDAASNQKAVEGAATWTTKVDATLGLFDVALREDSSLFQAVKDGRARVEAVGLRKNAVDKKAAANILAIQDAEKRRQQARVEAEMRRIEERERREPR